MARDELLEFPSSSSSSWGLNDLLRKCWKLQVPPRIKFFAWRLQHNMLSCAQKLRRRGIECDTVCVRCNKAEETVLHALKDCEISRCLWLASPMGFRSTARGYSHIVELIEEVSIMARKEALEQFITQLWACWNLRNEIIYDGKMMDPVVAMKRALAYTEDYKRGMLNTVSRSNEVDGRLIQWKKLPRSHMKINSNVAFNEATKEVGMEVLARDSEGEIIKWCAKRTRGANSPGEAEVMAILEGVALAKELQMKNVMFESDAMGVILALAKRELGLNHLYMIYEDILKLCSDFEDYCFLYSPRGGNEGAHRLAKLAICGQ